MSNSAFCFRFRIVGNNSANPNAPEKNLIIDCPVEEAKKCAMWLMQQVDKVDEKDSTIRIYSDKKNYDEVPGFSIWGGMWGNSGRIQPMPHKDASERTVDVQANQPELPDDLPF